MPDHYYTQTPTSQSRPALLHVELLGEHMVFHTDAGVFSRTELDPGSAPGTSRARWWIWAADGGPSGCFWPGKTLPPNFSWPTSTSGPWN